MEKLLGNKTWKDRIKGAKFQNKFGIMVFLLACFVMLLFFYTHSRDTFTGISGEKEPARKLSLSYGTVVQQEVPGKDTIMTGLSIRFGVNEGSNGTIHIQLYENEQLLEEWTVSSAELENDKYYNFPFQTPKKMNRDFAYRLSVTETSQEAQGVSVWLTEEKDRDCTVDGEQMEKYALCWQLIYTAPGLKNWVRLIACLLFFAAALAILWKVNEKVLMSGILIALGAVYFWMCPLGMMPDERNHFFRAYEISCGEWTSRHMGEDGGGGNYLPAALPDYQNPEAEIQQGEITELRYGNTSLYAPVSYLPQAVGIGLARLITNNVSKIFYAGRLGNFLVSMLLCVWAISMIPFGRRILFLIMMFPMSMQEMVSLAPDGFTIALSMAFLAFIFHLRSREETLNKKDLLLVGVMGCVIALCKIVYVVLLLLVFLLPQDKFRNKKEARLFQFGIPGAAFLVNLVWLKISAGYLIEFTPGVSSGEQVKYLLTHLPNYVMAVMRTVRMQGSDWIMTMIGNPLGALNIRISQIVWLTLLILLVYEVCSNRQTGWKTCKRDWIILLFIFLSGAALICTSLYVQWTAVASQTVSGVQGRYFIPLLSCLAMSVVCALSFRERKNGENKIYQAYGSYFYMLLLMLHGITVLDVLHYYI